MRFPEEDSETGRIVRFLETQTHMRDQRKVNSLLVNSLGLKPGQRWLEVGSGSGALSRLAAPYLLPNGQLVGVDLDPGFVAFALKSLDEDFILSSPAFLPADAIRLPFATGYFDGAFAARLLLNTKHPDEILREIMRVVRQAGKIFAMDWDFETLVVDHSQQELTRRILQWRADHYGSNSWSGRQLYARFRRVGMKRVQVMPVVSVGYSEKDALPDALRRAATAALAAGALSQGERDDWVGEIQKRLADGTFFSSIVYYIASAVQPI